MQGTGLEFAPGTTDDSKRLVAKIFKPDEILAAYRQARITFKNGDLVLAVSEKDPAGFSVEPRIAWLKRLQQALGSHAHKTLPVLGIANNSAHAVMKLPFESEAMWLIVTRGQELPVMCVLYALPYESTAAASN